MTGGRGARIFLAPERKVPSYATALRVVPAQCLGYAAKKFVA